MVLEYWGGYIANSLALLSDAVHMTTDAAALTLSLCTLWLTERLKHQRFEKLGALINGLAVWVIAAFLVYESVERFQSPEIVRGDWVLSIASAGLLANLVSAWVLHHSQKESLNVRAAYLHVLGDILGSVGAMIAGAVIYFTGWALIDPIITVLVSLLMIVSAARVIREAVK